MSLHMKNKINNNFKKASTLIITTSFIMGSISPVFANENSMKEEVVYVKLNDNGSINNVYVVNGFEDKKQITDYGNYINVLNLSNDKPLEFANGVLEMKSPVDNGIFYYQGEMDTKELPWNIKIRYFLDGESIKAEDLAGKSGKVEINIDIKQNKSVNKEFYDNYALQIGLNLDGERCKNINAENGTVASAGSTKAITYMKLAGTDANYKLTADVVDFEMDAISINGINMGMDVDINLSDMTKDLDKLVDAIKMINGGTSDLKSGLDAYSVGVNELNKGALKLDYGISQYKNGVVELNEGMKGLSNGISDYKVGVNTLYSSSQNVVSIFDEIINKVKAFEDKLQDLLDKIKPLNKEVKELSNQSSKYKNNLNNYDDNVKNSINNIKSTLSEEQLALIENELNNIENNTNNLHSNYNDLYSKLDNINKEAKDLNTVIEDIKIKIPSLSEVLQTIYGYVSEFNNGIGALNTGIEDIDSGMKGLVKGSDGLVTGITDLNKGSSGLSSGSSKLVTGINEINKGVNGLNNGTNELENETNNIPSEIDKQFNEMKSKFSGEDFEPISFVSEENKNIESVQFAIRTEGISKPEQSKEEIKEEKQSVWEMFLNLFKKDK